MRSKALAIIATTFGILGLIGFFAFDGIAHETEGQVTVSQILWGFLDWGPASYILVGGILIGVFGWAVLHILGRGRWG
jgi:hypothetical protein